MGFNKILLQLKELLQKKKSSKKKNDAIRSLLKKLGSKQQKLELKLKKEKDQVKRKDIKISLRVIIAQQKKGQRLLDEFKSK